MAFAICISINAQTLKFDEPKKIITKEEKQDHTVSVGFSMTGSSNDEIEVKIEVDADKSSATAPQDFKFDAQTITLKKGESYKGKFDVVIKADDFREDNEEIKLKLTYKDDHDKNQSEDYLIIILDVNDGREDEPIYTEHEKSRMRRISYDLFTGGTFDFFDALKFQHVGGELVLNARDIIGTEDRFGFYTGVFNFQNFSFDSSNHNVREQYIQIDSGRYIPGTTRYVHNTYVDHPKISTNQWGYYFNPTFRLNKVPSDLFNIYAAFRMEVVRTSTKTEFVTDTVYKNDTSKLALANPVFSSGKGFLLQKYVSTKTNGYFGLGFPIWLYARDKVKFFFEPNWGIASYSYTVYTNETKGGARTAVEKTINPSYYLFRFRAIDQFSGLQITAGGEIRGLFGYTPSINLYLGIRADLAKWFKKE